MCPYALADRARVMFHVLGNGLVLMNVNSFWQDVANGLLLIAAVSFDRLRLRLAGREQ